MSDFIPPEVVTTEILTRLPVKSLLRFRCVCKEWFCIISNPNFTTKHLSNYSSLSSRSQTLLVRHYSKLHSKEIYALYQQTPRFTGTRINFPSSGGRSKFYSRIVGYCNGVLCLSDDLFGYNETIILWNPSVRRAINVPSPSVTRKLVGKYVFALGFGFDSVKNDYKIVRVAYLIEKRGYKVPPVVEVFSVFSGKWSRVKSRKIGSFVITEYFWSQAVRDGVVHWFGNDPSRKGECLIASFDLSKETFGKLSLPNFFVYGIICQTRALILRGLLSLLYYDNEKPVCDVWSMMEYGDVTSWVCLYNVSLEGGLETILGMPRKDEIFMSSRDGELILYDCVSAATKGTEIFGTRLSFFVDEYVESLALLGKGREVRGRDSEPDYEYEDELIEMVEYENITCALENVLVRITNTRLT